jgi:hypothetical protein
MWRRRLGWGTIRAQITFGSISNPQVIDSKGRDGRVVEGARLESDALQRCRDVPKHNFRSRFNDLAPGTCFPVFPRK